MEELKWMMIHRGRSFSWGVTEFISGGHNICRVNVRLSPPFFHLPPSLCFSGKLSTSLIAELHSQHSPVAPGSWDGKSGEQALRRTFTHWEKVHTASTLSHRHPSALYVFPPNNWQLFFFFFFRWYLNEHWEVTYISTRVCVYVLLRTRLMAHWK